MRKRSASEFGLGACRGPWYLYFAPQPPHVIAFVSGRSSSAPQCSQKGALPAVTEEREAAKEDILVLLQPACLLSMAAPSREGAISTTIPLISYPISSATFRPHAPHFHATSKNDFSRPCISCDVGDNCISIIIFYNCRGAWCDNPSGGSDPAVRRDSQGISRLPLSPWQLSCMFPAYVGFEEARVDRRRHHRTSVPRCGAFAIPSSLC